MTQKISIEQYQSKALAEPFPKSIFRSVYEHMSSVGYEVPNPDTYTVPDDAEGLRQGAGILPRFMVGAQNDIPDLIRTGILFPFDLEGTLDDQVETENQGAHVTTQFIDTGNAVLEDTIQLLYENRKLDLAIKNVERSVDQNTNTSASEVVAFALATYAKGWMVEFVLAGDDRFEKGTELEDTEGKDLYDSKVDEWVQLKSVTSMSSKSRAKLDAHNVSYLYYQFDCDGNIVVGKDPNKVNGEAAEVKDMSKTLIKRCHSTYKFNGRTYRYLWW